MIPARLESVLLYADGVQLAVLRDAVNCAYIAVLSARDTSGDTYLCTRISPSRLGDLRRGRVDLRDALDSPEQPTWFSGVVSASMSGHLDLTQLDHVPAHWLPDRGFQLAKSIGEEDADSRLVTTQASERNRAFIHLHLDPPEAHAETKIDAGRLSRALAAFQRVVDRALRVAPPASRGEGGRPAVEVEESTLQVLSFGHGSFGVYLQAKAQPNLFGETRLARALERIDELVSKSSDPPAVVTAAREYRGHFVGAYQDLLKFVFEGETPLSYVWSDPLSTRAYRQTIEPARALEVYRALVEREELSQEEVVLFGTFDKVDVRSGTWRLRDADGVEHAGETKEGTGNLLSGVVIEVQKYFLRCHEILTEVAGTGRQQAKLVLSEVRAEDSGAPT